MNYKKGFIWIVTLLLLISPVLAAESFEIKIIPIENSILLIEQAEFEVSVTNNQQTEGTFRLSITNVDWSVKSEPLHDYFGGIDIAPGQTKKTKLFLTPIGQVLYGKNLVKLEIKSEATQETITEYLEITVTPVHALKEYLAAVRRIVEIPTKVDPREILVISINLENKNPKNITDMRIQLKSNLIDKEITTDLNPLQKKTLKVEIKLDPLTPPQEDTLRAVLIIENKTLEPIKESFEIISYSTIVEGEKPVQRSFLKTVKATSYYNDGNAPKKKIVEIKTSWLKQFFTETKPEAFAIKKDDGRYSRWELNLEPQQTTEITIEENYRGLVAIILIIIAALIAYIMLKSPISLRKEAIIISTTEGGISELKVLLHIKNNSSKPYNKLTIIDRVPSIAELKKETEIGTIKPSKAFKHRKQGTIIKWNVGTLERYEERIISYKIVSRLSIIGGFRLPNALATFVNEKGKEQLAKSNKVRVSS